MTSAADSTQIPVVRSGRRKRIAGLLAVCAVGGGIWYAAIYQRALHGALHVDEAKPAEKQTEAPVGEKTPVEVIHPRAGGIKRVCIQPGSLEPVESADLYAKVSGFLSEQSVDIGSRVKKGQVLAKLAVPEYEKQVQRDAATLSRAKAKVQQMEAHVVSAEAESRSAKSMIEVSQSEVQSKTAYRTYRKKQLDRMKQLSEMKAVDSRLVDENEDQYEAAFGAENTAKIGVSHARLNAEAAEAKIAEAKADLADAKAQIEVAEAELARTRVMLAYTEITAPFDGVITKRSFRRGDFIRSADVGGDRVPLLSIERTDHMIMVVQVPDRDVPFLDVGDEATMELDALPGSSLNAVVSRCAESEDISTRTMRTEVDIPNTSGKLRRGMYGRVTVVLDKGQAKSMMIPSTALTGKAEGGKGTVRVVRDGTLRLVSVTTGADNGLEVEILSGLSTNDQVVVRTAGPVKEGSPVIVTPTAPAASGH
ncbi:efflux RND transporter periplasmic adaptor subunit [Zavarzinella formosa]|uniref:efflux RND transporter periplasmic adaptor subunit n=1 Tax=Zavarzinella formosa TaxID=360055 RepID=UPI00030FD8C1|nr:efflux RND transporter periplasmic adaptor subunit [Zavarzinella formosa]